MAFGTVYHYDGSGKGNTLFASDAVTGDERWKHSGRDINGIFAVNNLLYAYDESLENYGPNRDPAGEYLNGYNPLTGAWVQRLLFSPGYSPLSSLSALAWLPQHELLIGTYQMYSVGIQHVELRAFYSAGKLAWSRPHIGTFQVINGLLVCQNSRQIGVNGESNYDVESGIIALDPATGHTLWRRDDIEYRGLTVWNGTVVARTSSKLIGLDPQSGKTLWNLPLRAGPKRVTSRDKAPRAGRYITRNGKTRWVDLPQQPSEFSVRSYGKYLVVGESKRTDKAAGLRVYAAGGS